MLNTFLRKLRFSMRNLSQYAPHCSGRDCLLIQTRIGNAQGVTATADESDVYSWTGSIKPTVR